MSRRILSIVSTTLQARSKIAKRGQLIGLDFDREVESLRSAADWEAELEAVRDPSLQLPAYYTQPFHAYSEGNLCWDAALQVRASLQSCLSRGVRVCLSRKGKLLPAIHSPSCLP